MNRSTWVWLVLAVVGAVSAETVFDFNNRSMQGWHNRVWDAGAAEGKGAWVDLPADVIDMPKTINGGKILPEDPGNNLFFSSTDGYPGDQNEQGSFLKPKQIDQGLNVKWVRSPAFHLTEDGDLTFDFVWGKNIDSKAPASEADIPFAADKSQSAWVGLCLRDAGTGRFVLTCPGTGQMGGRYVACRFPAEALQALDRTRSYTLDLITLRAAFESWIALDNVVIPGVLDDPVLRAKVKTRDRGPAPVCEAVPLMRGGNGISLASLLMDLADRESLSYLDAVPFTTRLYSSYDRRTTTADKPDWFANDDHSQFVRIEEHEGKKWGILADLKGPGAIVRFWVTVAGTDGTGTLRIYIDGNLAVEGRVLDVISGGALCGAPLSSSVSPRTDYLHRGHDLYLPIPFAASCKVMYTSPTQFAAKRSESFYYNLEARRYPQGTPVESFSKAVLQRERVTIDEVNRRLAGSDKGLLGKPCALTAFDATLAPGESLTRRFKGPAAIRQIALSVNRGHDGQALRSTVLSLTFDGERTVWVPMGDFFGTGYQLAASHSWYSDVTPDGVMTCAWVMPFERDCEMTIHNYGTGRIVLSDTQVVTAPYRWDGARSMHFGAGWTEYAKHPTRINGSHHDLNYVTLTGTGRLLGTALTLYNGSDKWWGEGDEKVFVDGETAPSFVGTGSEDYYGYAWGRPEPFSHPFLMQPNGSGATAAAIVLNTRNRVLDAIPFTKGIQFDMEMWHWQDTKVNYATTAYWYMRPGGTSNRGEAVEAVRRPVPKSAKDVL
ncbi:MAG: DUF2961 domain-containing protein [Kiritimatiellae bacterium]|nr:DUF2961 domain-containing protein [Kiritimatiellia bacterium]